MVFNRHRGRKWLADILEDVSASSYKWMKETAPERSRTALNWSARVFRHLSIPLKRMSAMFSRSSVSAEGMDGAESIPPPLYGSPIVPQTTGVMTSGPDTSPAQPATEFQLVHEGPHSGETSGRPSDASPVGSPAIPPSSPEPGRENPAARARFRNLARSAVMVNRLIGIGNEAKAKVSVSLTTGKAPDLKPIPAAVRPKSSRVAGLVPKLQNMAPTQDIAAHTALVRHMEVSV